MNLSENESKNKKVQVFLEEVMSYDEEIFFILEELREIVFTQFKETNERMMYGGIMFSNEREEDWGGIYPYKNHVSFEFGQGFKLKDPNNILEGTGKKRRHIKIKLLSDIDKKNIESFVKEAMSLLLKTVKTNEKEPHFNKIMDT